MLPLQTRQAFERIGERVATWGCAVLMAFVAACGGADSGGTGATPPTYTSGPITGFGSVIVGDVHYDDRSANITDADGAARTRDDLKLGMTTEIQGTLVVTDANAVSSSTASSIVYSSAIVGAVTSIDPAAKTIAVLGQTVTVTATTVFDAALANGLASLAPGDVIEVYALAGNGANSYLATRIERKAGAAAFVLRSAIANLNTTAKTFDLGGLAVSYAGLPAGDTGTLANGQFLRVQLPFAPVGGVWAATRLQSGVRAIGNHNDARVEGLITFFNLSTQFSVDGVTVDASHATFPDGTLGLALGVRVSVEGTVQGQVLLATKVRIRSESQIEIDGFELDGVISSIDTTAQLFVVRGVTVDYSGSVEYRDGTVADLAAGHSVEVKGSLSNGGTRLQAQRIRLR